MIAVNVARLHAYDCLLRQPDEWALRGKRGHRVTCAGASTRFQQLWVPVTRAWVQHQVSRLAGTLDGWTPGRAPMPFLSPRRIGHRA